MVVVMMMMMTVMIERVAMVEFYQKKKKEKRLLIRPVKSLMAELMAAPSAISTPLVSITLQIKRKTRLR